MAKSQDQLDKEQINREHDQRDQLGRDRAQPNAGVANSEAAYRNTDNPNDPTYRRADPSDGSPMTGSNPPAIVPGEGDFPLEPIGEIDPATLPRSRDGQLLVVGDRVTLACTVLKVYPTTQYSNVELETDEGLYPNTEKSVLCLNTRQLTKS